MEDIMLTVVEQMDIPTFVKYTSLFKNNEYSYSKMFERFNRIEDLVKYNCIDYIKYVYKRTKCIKPKALIRASKYGHLELLEFLVENGPSKKIWKCVWNAIRNSDLEMLEFLLEFDLEYFKSDQFKWIQENSITNPEIVLLDICPKKHMVEEVEFVGNVKVIRCTVNYIGELKLDYYNSRLNMTLEQLKKIHNCEVFKQDIFKLLQA